MRYKFLIRRSRIVFGRGRGRGFGVRRGGLERRGGGYGLGRELAFFQQEEGKNCRRAENYTEHERDVVTDRSPAEADDVGRKHAVDSGHDKRRFVYLLDALDIEEYRGDAYPDEPEYAA